MALKVSPLAPTHWPILPPIAGVKMASVEAGIKYKGRKDLCALVFDKPAAIAGTFTQSRCPSAAVDWCKRHIGQGQCQAIVVNSGNANAFTGTKGEEATQLTAQAAADVFSVPMDSIFLASTGVIGEPLDASGFSAHLTRLHQALSPDRWEEAAHAIMTTDTYHKMATQTFDVAARTYRINAIAKGSGMIAPDMATMLGFAVTDFPVHPEALQICLHKAVNASFNAITVDSDTSTSDTVLLASIGGLEEESGHADHVDLQSFQTALNQMMLDLAMAIVRDGEGASKHVEIEIVGAVDDQSAKNIGFSIANSPLVKTAIAGEDANWGRIVMAVGKAGEPADRDRLSIWIAGHQLAEMGERASDYDEAEITQAMSRDFIPICVDIGLGEGRAKVWTCDFTHEYISINADYRS